MPRIPNEPGDLIFTPGVAAVRFFQRMPGESFTYAGHVAGIARHNLVSEALTVVTTTPLDLWDADHPAYEIWRLQSLSLQQRVAIGEALLRETGRVYAGLKLGAHLTDWAIAWARYGLSFGHWTGEIRGTRRLLGWLKISAFQICSTHLSVPYKQKARYDAWGDAWETNPDSMRDWVEKDPAWERVHQKLPAPA